MHGHQDQRCAAKMRDGTILRADVYRPDHQDPSPSS